MEGERKKAKRVRFNPDNGREIEKREMWKRLNLTCVTPAKAGVQKDFKTYWMPVFTGMTT